MSGTARPTIQPILKGRKGHAVFVRDLLPCDSTTKVPRTDFDNGIIADSCLMVPFARKAVASFCHHVLGVDAVRSEKQMGGIATRRIVTTMQDALTFRNRSIGQFVGDAVTQVLFAVSPDDTVSRTKAGTLPFPTRLGTAAPINTGPKTVSNRRRRTGTARTLLTGDTSGLESTRTGNAVRGGEPSRERGTRQFLAARNTNCGRLGLSHSDLQYRSGWYRAGGVDALPGSSIVPHSSLFHQCSMAGPARFRARALKYRMAIQAILEG